MKFMITMKHCLRFLLLSTVFHNRVQDFQGQIRMKLPQFFVAFRIDKLTSVVCNQLDAFLL